MKRIYAFVAGNSRVTPAGVALAVILAIVAQRFGGWWIVPAYLGVLLTTLAAATAEPVQ